MVTIQQYHKSVKAARKFVSKDLDSPHGSLAKDFGAEYKLKSVKLVKGKNPRIKGRRLYTITLVKRKRARAHRPFRSRKK